MKTHRVRQIIHDWQRAEAEAKEAGLSLRLGDHPEFPFEVVNDAGHWIFRTNHPVSLEAFCAGYSGPFGLAAS